MSLMVHNIIIAFFLDASFAKYEYLRVGHQDAKSSNPGENWKRKP